MKKLTFGVAALAAMAMSTAAWAQAVNTTCPVKGTPVKNITAQYEGKTIAFC